VAGQPSGLGIGTDRSKLRTRILPDSICLDSEGAVWVDSPGSGAEVFRVFESGEIVDRNKVECFSYACMPGGEDGKTLFICISDLESNELAGRVETTQVAATRAGFP